MANASASQLLASSLIAGLALLPAALVADRITVEAGLNQSVRDAELEGHETRDAALRLGPTGANRGTSYAPWSGNWSATLPLRLEYDRRPGGQGALVRFRFAEYWSHYRFTSLGRNRFSSRSFDLYSEQEVAEHRSSDQDLEGGYRLRLRDDLSVLGFFGVRLHRLSGTRRGRTLGRGFFGDEQKSIYGFINPDHSRFRAEAFGPLAGADVEWRGGSWTLTVGLRAVQIDGELVDSNVSLLYNAGLGVNYMQGRFSYAGSGYRIGGILARIGTRYHLAPAVALSVELQQENYQIKLPEYTGLEVLTIESVIVNQETPSTEVKLLPVDDREILYDRIFYEQPQSLGHTTLFLGVAVKIDFGPDATAPVEPKPEEPKKADDPPAGPGETALVF